jgi:hypothetical protein
VAGFEVPADTQFLSPVPQRSLVYAKFLLNRPVSFAGTVG